MAATSIPRAAKYALLALAGTLVSLLLLTCVPGRRSRSRAAVGEKTP